MKRLLQNNPNMFQIENMKSIYNLNGIFRFENDKCFHLEINDNILTINNNKYIIYKNPNYVGGSYWLSSIAMLLFIEKNKTLFINNKILELGSGLGLPGIHISKSCIFSEISLSDIDSHITQISINMNNIININNIQLDWNNIDNYYQQYDIIIASDCIYRNTKNIFITTIKKLLKSNGILIMFNPDRDGINEFEYALQELSSNIIIETHKLIYNEIYYIDLLFYKMIME